MGNARARHGVAMMAALFAVSVMLLLVGIIEAIPTDDIDVYDEEE